MTLQAPLFSMGIDIASSGKADDVVDVALATMRTHLGMEVAYMSEFVDNRAVFPADGGPPKGFEALSRFQTATYRTPDLWFSDAEVVGRGVELEALAIEAALPILKVLPAGVYLSVNASPATITAGDLPALFARNPCKSIVLEITEHEVVADYAQFVCELGRLTQAGVEIAIDDVGTGYSGLSHLLKAKPHLMKLDIELVQGIDGDLARQSLVKGLSHFARTTGCRLVAEGVETAAELHTLRDLGVDLIQGYLLGRPSDVKTALAWF